MPTLKSAIPTDPLFPSTRCDPSGSLVTESTSQLAMNSAMNSAGCSKYWLAVTTHPHQERLAVEGLRRQAFNVYCPVVHKQIRHARRTQDVLRPLFPGYIFVYACPDEGRWRSISYTFGVRNLVRSGTKLGFVPGDLIASLKAREVAGVIQRPIQPYEIGQDVKFRGGAFDGLAATIIEVDEKDRLVILMSLLNHVVRVKVDAAQIKAV